MQRRDSFVDETGQDTQGKHFIVAAPVFDQEREEAETRCEKYEVESGKGKFKWGKAQADNRLRYMRMVISDPIFARRLRFAVFKDTRKYDDATVSAIARSLSLDSPDECECHIFIDGLAESKRNEYRVKLSKYGFYVKIHAVARDESNALVRLADAIVGFVRDVQTGEANAEMMRLYQRAIEAKILIEV
jgi:hypothetical protein